MSVRAFPGGAANGNVAHGTPLSGATTGPKLTYTCPAGFQARVIGVWVNVTAGAAEIAVECSFGGAIRQLQRSTTSFQLVGNITLDPGSLCRLSVNVLDAASTFTGVICVEEYPVV